MFKSLCDAFTKTTVNKRKVDDSQLWKNINDIIGNKIPYTELKEVYQTKMFFI